MNDTDAWMRDPEIRRMRRIVGSAAAIEIYDDGSSKSLKVGCGWNCPSKIEWRDDEGNRCEPPAEIASAWKQVEDWIEAHKRDDLFDQTFRS